MSTGVKAIWHLLWSLLYLVLLEGTCTLIQLSIRRVPENLTGVHTSTVSSHLHVIRWYQRNQESHQTILFIYVKLYQYIHLPPEMWIRSLAKELTPCFRVAHRELVLGRHPSSKLLASSPPVYVDSRGLRFVLIVLTSRTTYCKLTGLRNVVGTVEDTWQHYIPQVAKGHWLNLGMAKRPTRLYKCLGATNNTPRTNYSSIKVYKYFHTRLEMLSLGKGHDNSGFLSP